MDSLEIEQIVNDLLTEHHSVFARRHAERAGVPHDHLDRKIDRGALQVIHRGVLRRPGTPLSFRQRVEAARLAVGDEAVAGRRTAGALHELVPAWEIEILTTANRRARPAGITVIRTNYLPDQQVVPVHGIPITSVPRTILDLGGVLPEPQVRRVVKDALRLGKTSEPVLREVFADACRPGRPGSAIARRMVVELGSEADPTESDLEDEMFKTLQRGGFPKAARQLSIYDDDLFIARVDGAYPDQLVALEADGYEWHSAKPEWLKDRRRSNYLVSLGWVVLHFTWEDVARPASFLKALEKTLALRSRLLAG